MEKADCVADIPCGRFQVFLVFLTQMTRFSTVWGLYIMMFGNYEPPWRCVLQDNHNDGHDETPYSTAYPHSIFSKHSFTTMNGSNNHSQQIHPNSVFDNGGGQRNSNSYYNINHNIDDRLQEYVNNNESSYADNYNGSCQIYPSCREIEFEPGSSTIVTEFDLICDRAWIASLIISVKMLAIILGSYVGGHIGERFGRKVSLYGSTGLLCVSTGLGILSFHWIVYAVSCFFIGLACGGILSTASVLSMEFLNPWWRATFASIPMWNVSQVLFVLVITWLRDWRLIHVASSIVSGVTFLGVFWVPESVRWLEVHGRKTQAKEVVQRIYRFNQTKNITFSQPLMELNGDPQACDSNVKTVKIDTVDDHDTNEDKKTYLDLFRNPYIRSITIKCSLAWVTSHIAYTSMGYGIKSLPGDYYTNAIIASVSEVPVILSIGPLANRIGRRWSAVIYLSLAIAACVVLVIAHYVMEEGSKGMVLTLSALVAKSFVASVWCALITMAVELFPTVIRNLAYGFLNLVAGAGGVAAPYLIPQDPSWFGICFLILIGMMLICTFVTLGLPETMAKNLSDNIVSGSNGASAPSRVALGRDEDEESGALVNGVET